MEKSEILNVIASMGLTVESVFVPFSQSRNKGEKQPSLNWKVTLCKNSVPVLLTDYSAGCTHVPGYEQFPKAKNLHFAIIHLSCEKGIEHAYNLSGVFAKYPTKRILPDTLDVIYSLQFDVNVLNYRSFEDWAGIFGHNPDSRRAEKIYQDCLEMALALRNAIGEQGMQALSEAFQDY